MTSTCILLNSYNPSETLARVSLSSPLHLSPFLLLSHSLRLKAARRSAIPVTLHATSSPPLSLAAGSPTCPCLDRLKLESGLRRRCMLVVLCSLFLVVCHRRRHFSPLGRR
ncbi:unnamed protein product [Protopolystoma xenopodis]|uniref:Uncharacterized protein n=1 Tax=Protopolystoma xenopodis TaxID=117903 RepID=A0A3S5BJ83_9PLAT|nr:unnamed protein product [Protopolystoma xenopodis]